MNSYFVSSTNRCHFVAVVRLVIEVVKCWCSVRTLVFENDGGLLRVVLVLCFPKFKYGIFEMPVDEIRYREWNQLMDENTRSSMVAAGDNDR